MAHNVLLVAMSTTEKWTIKDCQTGVIFSLNLIFDVSVFWRILIIGGHMRSLFRCGGFSAAPHHHNHHMEDAPKNEHATKV